MAGVSFLRRLLSSSSSSIHLLSSSSAVSSIARAARVGVSVGGGGGEGESFSAPSIAGVIRAFTSRPPLPRRTPRPGVEPKPIWSNNIEPSWAGGMAAGRGARDSRDGEEGFLLSSFPHHVHLGAMDTERGDAARRKAEALRRRLRGGEGGGKEEEEGGVEPVFAVVECGPHQFKVAVGDVVHVERLKDSAVNDVIGLKRVLVVGGRDKTGIGRPYLPGAVVVAAIEEHYRDEKVYIFKMKRRKNHRRFNGHRQELTALRILDIITPPEFSSSPSSSPSSSSSSSV